ncbi:MAG: YIP1 family protein [Acidobacteriota bacterium]
MTATAAEPKGLVARIFGVLVAPRATYADVAARPRWLGVLAVVLLVMATGSIILFSTTVGQEALLDQQVSMIESFGVKLPAERYQAMEANLARPTTPYVTAAGQVVFVPIMALIIAGIAMGIFTAVLGGDATFKQVFSVVAHAGVVSMAQQLFVYPLDYARGSLSSPTNLGVFLPFLDEMTFAARLLGTIDLFLIWWLVNLAIGLGVLYKRRTGPIAVGFLSVYLVIALIIAAIRTAVAGA